MIRMIQDLPKMRLPKEGGRTTVVTTASFTGSTQGLMER